MASQIASADIGKEKASAPAKGTVGLALIGAEAVMTVEALVGVKKWWAYALGGGVGAVAGGVGGYFVDRADKPGMSMGFLVGGLVLAVPTTIAVLSATAYKPPKNPEVDQLSAEQRAFERWQAARFAPTPSAFSVTETGQFRLGVPAVDVRPVYSEETAQRYSLRNAASVRVPVFNLTF